MQQLVLEYATPRAGEMLAFEDKEVGLGVVNPRTDEDRNGGRDRRRAYETRCSSYPKEKLFLNPDCGFGTFAARPMNDSTHVEAKLRALSQAARTLREGIHSRHLF